MDELIELIRKFESLFLPLLPRKWQNPPPSYRIIVPLLEKIGPYRQWVLPVSVWIIPMIAYGMGWRPPLIGEIGMLGAVALWGAFAVGITLLAWKQKESFLREWIFWGLFLFFLFQQYRSDTQINYHLLKGFTFLGVPFMIYHLIMGQFLRKDLSRSPAWSWILIAGLGFTQILQGVEHFVVARFEGQTLDQLQKMLLDALLGGTPLGDVAPAWLVNFYWIFVWRAFRWVSVMLALSWAIRRRHRGEWEMANSALTFCFASLAVWAAEAIWIFWPFLPLEWAVILRPWVETTLMWDWSSFKLYLLYLLAGLLCGWLFFRTFPSPSQRGRASS